MSNEPGWRLYTAEGDQGPYTTEDLRAWRAAGRITDDWYVWREGFADWKRIGDTPELLVNSSPTGRGAALQPPPAPISSGWVDQPAATASDAIFNRDKFLLSQKHLAINEKYDVWDEEGKSLLFVERPRRVFRSVAAVGAAALAFFFSCALLATLAVKGHLEPQKNAWLIWLIVVGSSIPAVLSWLALAPKRHVTFYRDASRGGQSKLECVLSVLEDAAFQFPTVTYSVIDPKGRSIAKFQKNMIVSVIRKSWDCLRPDGTYLCNAMEDSIILSLLRRFIGPLFGLLRTNFVICKADTEEVVGEFNRKLAVLDRYVLDMTADPGRTIDRRVALALGVMLDTGERR